MTENQIIPLFVLPQGIFPYSQEPLRVFEPRYKQMLDDCVLNDSFFGYVEADLLSKSLDGWTPPSTYGVLSKAENISEQGANLLFTASGKERFKIIKIIPAALPSEKFDEVFPSVNELEELYINQSPNGKLYLRAEIEVLPKLKGIIEDTRWENFIISWSKHIIKMNILLGSNSIDIEELIPIIKNEFCPYSESKLWDLCQSILDTNELTQSALAAFTSEEIMALIENTLAEKNAQIEFIRSLINKEEE
ncbi:MAG: hypothetical protein CMB64_06145 [Euryarchaeota archaeon]|nr:hypothetical protein [Euryarchaeota archaeon]|tara:strand:+ start:724 stop:1470 length:747 start_codon:yes stop_codon:yes gene_type:complete